MASVTNSSVLHGLDVLHCGESVNEHGLVRVWHQLSRRFTAGAENRRNPNISIHTSLVFPVRKEKLVIEMIALQGLRFSSLNRTYDGLERNIISISRAPGIVIDEGLDRICRDISIFLKYDLSEAVKYALPFLKDDPRYPICSSYAFAVLQDCGAFFPPGMRKSPTALQNCSTLTEVRGW